MTVAVVGAGLAGLSAAWELSRAVAGWSCSTRGGDPGAGRTARGAVGAHHVLDGRSATGGRPGGDRGRSGGGGGGDMPVGVVGAGLAGLSAGWGLGRAVPRWSCSTRDASPAA